MVSASPAANGPRLVSPDELDRLVMRAQSGDRDAYREVVLAVHRDVRLLLSAFQVTEGLAEEILQSTFVKAYENLARYRPTGAFVGWIKTIARHLLLNELRAQKRLVAAEPDLIAEILVDDALADVERMEEIAAQVARLRDCVRKLNAEARDLVEARYLRDEDPDRLAARFKQSGVWVRVTLFRIRRLLRACIEEGEVA